MAWRRGQAYGQDLRERVLGAAGLSLRAGVGRGRRRGGVRATVGGGQCRLRQDPRRNLVTLSGAVRLRLRIRRCEAPDCPRFHLPYRPEAEGALALPHLAGLRHDGIVAPLMLDGPINGEAFLAWTEQFLAPDLRPGDIVVADRLGSHKGMATRQAIEARGAELMLLPSYSHDLNPIEQVFAKLKALLRKAAPRTREALWRTIGEKLSLFTPAECRNYLRHCGYGHPA